MKLKYSFETIIFADEITAVPTDEQNDFRGIIMLNETGKFIMELLKEDTTEDKLVSDVLAEYNGNETQIRDYVKKFIGNLRENDLLIEG